MFLQIETAVAKLRSDLPVINIQMEVTIMSVVTIMLVLEVLVGIG